MLALSLSSLVGTTFELLRGVAVDSQDGLPLWLDAIRDGDRQAADQFVQRYEPELRRYVRYRLTDPKMRRFLDSLDVTQSVFARFFVCLSEGRIDVEHPRQLFKLLFTMAGNRMRDHVRWNQRAKRQHGLATGPQEDFLDQVAGTAPDPGQQVAENELLSLFHERLSEDERQLLAGRLDGQSWQELAEGPSGTGEPADGIRSPEALRKKLTRAIDRVAAELGLGTES